MHTSAPKLHKVGEYGHGKTVLVISSSNFFSPGLHADLINRLNQEPKVFLYSFDLYHKDFEGSEINHLLDSLANTLNKFHFANTIVIDYLVYIFLLSNYHKVDLMQKGFKHLIIVNPIHENTHKYISLLGEEIKLDSLPKTQLKEIQKTIFDINGDKIDVISLQDLKQSVKVSSQIKNSKLHKSKNKQEVLDKIIDLITDGKV